jgi:voltage-gated potassium channel Kch
MELISQIIIAIGSLLKIIDDHYDMKLFTETIANIAQISIVILSIYLFTQDKAFTLMTMLTCIYVLCAEGQMEDSDGKTVKFYYIFNAITLAFFLYHMTQSGYGEILNSLSTLEIVRIILFGLFIYYENKMIPEDISKRKIIIRILITLLAVGYIYYESQMEEKTLIIRDVYLLAIGYMGTSVLDMLYVLYQKNQPERAV